MLHLQQSPKDPGTIAEIALIGQDYSQQLLTYHVYQVHPWKLLKNHHFQWAIPTENLERNQWQFGLIMHLICQLMIKSPILSSS